MAGRFLESRGHSVFTVASPFGVTAIVTRERPEVAVLDAMMPALGGEAVARFLGALPEHERPRIVFYSALPLDQLRAMAARVPGSSYVSKTSSLDALAAAVEARKTK